MSTTHQALSEFCPVKTGIRGRFLRPQWHLGLDLKILWWPGFVGFHSPLGGLSHVSLKSIFGNNSNCSATGFMGIHHRSICWSCLPQDDDEENVTHHSQFCDMQQICWMFFCYSMGSSNHLEHMDNFLRVCSLMLQYHVAAARIAWQMGRGNTKRKSVTRESQFSIGNFRVFRSDKDHTTRLAPFTNGHNCQAFQKRKTIGMDFF